MAYFLLVCSIVAEVYGTTMLKISDGFSKWLPIVGVISGFSVCFYLLSIALVELPLGFAYAIWSGSGTILTALIGVFAFKEKINRKGMLGIGFLLVGITLLNLIE